MANLLKRAGVQEDMGALEFSDENTGRRWAGLVAQEGPQFQWDSDCQFIRRPPFYENHRGDRLTDIRDARPNGLYGFGEILSNLQARDDRNVVDTKITRVMPSREELKEATPPALRGTALGALFGVLPGTGAILASFMSYALERRLTRRPKEFGNGAIAGLAGPEAANNAAAQTAFIPLLTLGLPGSAVSALIIGALTMQGITPGPQVMTDKPGLFWGLIASFWIGNLLLLVINMPLVRIWVLMLKVPYRML